MRKQFFFITICFLLTLNQQVKAQTAVAFEEAGDAAFSRKDYNAALSYYLQSLEKDGKKTAILWKCAETCRSYNSYTLASKYYEKVAAAAEKKEYPLAPYWIALMKKYSGDYKGAKEGFIEVMGSSKISDEYISLARKEIKSCEWAIGMISKPTDITIEHLGKNVNTPYSEFGAVKFNDTLYFSSLRFENKEDKKDPPRLISKVLATADTTTAKPIRKFNAENMHTASTAFSAKGNRVYFCHCQYQDSNGDQIMCDLYVRNRQGNAWGNAEKLPETINVAGTSTTQPTIAQDEKGQEILYFVSDRKDGKGKNDIWYAFVLANGGFSSPINAASINTRGDEVTPFFHQKTNTLYFSSDGNESLGGLDIYAAAKKGNTFATPVNMGAPLNSSYNDLYFNLLADGKEAYFSSNRVGSLFLDKKNETCCYDVYKAKLPKKTPPKEKEKTPTVPKIEAPLVVNTPTKTPPNSTTTNAPKPSTTVSNTPNKPAANTTNTPPNVKNNTNTTTVGTPAKQNIPVGVDVPPSRLEDFLPLPLYFDNDEPDNNTKAITTSKTYEQALNSYYARKVAYMEKSSKAIKTPVEKMQVETDMMTFFETTIKRNFTRLQQFTPILLSRLYKGENIEIIVRGFASPLAKNDYNTSLGKRRVASLMNYWNTFEGGVFKKYIDNGQLKLTQVSFGEDTAAKDISDDQRNESASIYSIQAARERRIEIIEIKKF